MIDFTAPLINLRNLPALPPPSSQSSQGQNASSDKLPREKDKIIQTPSFSEDISEIQRNIKDDEDDIQFHVHYHQNLEILERRIRNKSVGIDCTTECIADLYGTMEGFIISKDEIKILDSYNDNFDTYKIPDFWEPRVYDPEEEKLSHAESNQLKDKIEKAMEIIFQKKIGHNDSKQIINISDSDDETSKNEYNELWYLPHPPVKGYRRSIYRSPYVIQWRTANYLTDDSEDETDVEDFQL